MCVLYVWLNAISIFYTIWKFLLIYNISLKNFYVHAEGIKNKNS